MRNKFDMQLDHLNELLTQMGELCVKAIDNAAKALQSGDKELAQTIIREDEEIDHIEKEVEALCLKLLLQQQPVARDLRQISAALKMITDMERIGDQTADISDIVIAAQAVEAKDVSLVIDMADATSRMVRESVAAFVNKDLELTRKVMLADDEVDDLFDEIRLRLIELIKEKREPGETAIDILMIAKYLERIGDHATNIAEWVEFSITGVHQNDEQTGNPKEN